MNSAAMPKASTGNTALHTRPTAALETNLAVPFTVSSAPMPMLSASVPTISAVTMDSKASCTAT